MKPFSMLLRDTQHWQRLEGVRIFVGEDASGSLGLLADHPPTITHYETFLHSETAIIDGNLYFTSLKLFD